MRRGIGHGRFQTEKERTRRLAKEGEDLKGKTIEHVETQLRLFKEELARFATTHKARINSDAAFRHRFQQMTVAAGVDPLLSNKGFWGELLGVGDFYFELGVQILDVCISTRPLNGGIMSVQDCLAHIRKARGGPAAASASSARAGVTVTLEDVGRAVQKLAALGNGISVQQVRRGMRPTVSLLVSVPQELSADTAAAVAALTDSKGHASAPRLAEALGWETERAERAVARLVAEGMVWLDGADVWLPGVFLDG